MCVCMCCVPNIACRVDVFGGSWTSSEFRVRVLDRAKCVAAVTLRIRYSRYQQLCLYAINEKLIVAHISKKFPASYGTSTFSTVQHINYQLTHTTLKNVELLKHFKISKTAPTCFGLQGNHHQGATTSALRCVIPVVCVTNEREESAVNQHN